MTEVRRMSSNLSFNSDIAKDSNFKFMFLLYYLMKFI